MSMSFVFYFFLFLFLIVTVILAFVILIQDSKSMGLGSSFGGDAGDSLFGTSTADVLKKFTAYLLIIFVSFSLFLSLWTSSMVRKEQKDRPMVIEEFEK